MTFISIENLTTHYDTSKGKIHALDNVSFSLEKGQSVGIAGESACGKSTLGLSLIRMISNGKIVTGKIIFDGKSYYHGISGCYEFIGPSFYYKRTVY